MSKYIDFRNIVCRWKVVLLLILMLPSFVACKDQSAATEKNETTSLPNKGAYVGLTLSGFNYTDHYIDQFSADGQAGGNLFVSSPDSGGGGSVCCVSYIVGQSAWKAKIRWQSGACTYNNFTDTNGKHLFEIYSYFKEVEVQVDSNIPKNPQYFEVHFFPDGHVEAAITEHSSRPRLSLSEKREDNSPYKPCANDKRPQK